MARLSAIALLAVCFSLGGAVDLLAGFEHLLTRRDTGSRRCNPDACMASLRRWAHLGNLPLKNSNDPAGLIDDFCSDLETTSRCANDRCSDRSDRAQMTFTETMTGVHEHICSDEGKDLMLDNKDCMTDLDIRTLMMECKSNNDDKCRMIEEIRQCMHTKASGQCGQKVADFVDGVAYYMAQPTATLVLSCQLSQPRQTDESFLGQQQVEV